MSTDPSSVGPAPGSPSKVLSTLMSIAPIPLSFFDTSLRLIYANDAAAEKGGYKRSEVEGRRLPELVPELWPKIKPMFDRAFAGERVLNVDVDFEGVDPLGREWTVNYYPVFRDGAVVAVACSSNDVTELRMAERALEVSNAVFAMLAKVNVAAGSSSSKQELFDAVCAIAVDTGHFRYAWVGEPKDGAITGVAKAGEDGGYMRALDAAGLMVTTDPEDRRSKGPTGQAYLRGEMSFVNDYFESPLTVLWRDAAKEVGFHGAAAIPIRQQGEVVAVLSVYAAEKDFFTPDMLQTLEEVSPSLSIAMDRFELERRRRVHEAELTFRERALTAATQGFVITDALGEDNPIIYASPTLEQLTGYRSEELIGQSTRIFVGPDTDSSAIERLITAIREERVCTVELLTYRKDGETFWNKLRLTPIFDDDGTLTNYVGVMTDATEQRKLELQVRQAQKMEAVGQLAGGVAHDFNNALTAIRAAADLALDEVGSSPVREDVQQIDKAAEHATQLTQQLLAFSRQQVLKPRSTDLNRVVIETGELVTRVVGSDIELREDLAPGLDSALVDRAQIQQVLINLFINARDAMPGGGTITVTTSAQDLDEGYVESGLVPKAGRYALIEVADNGEGMDDETQSRVFEPFFTTKSEGTGLGLATVYGIISQTGGLIEVDSQQHVGTTFRIYLPTTSAALAPTSSAPSDVSKAMDGTETILHVEDSEPLRPLVARALGRHGYTVLSACDADEAIEIVKSRGAEIDMVITDVVMPGLNGRELAEILRAQYPGLRVLFTSGYPADVVLRDGIAGAEVNFIEKPFLAKDLLPLVRSILDA